MAEETDRIFLYGKLRFPPLLEAVVGENLPGRAAILRDHRIRAAKGESFPLIQVAPGEKAPGLIVTLSREALRRMDFYESGFGYQPTPVEVEVGGKTEGALIYLPEPDRWQPGGEWSLDSWIATYGELSTAAAEEYMALYGKSPAEVAAKSYPQILLRAASRIRAQRAPRPQTVGKAPAVNKVDEGESRRPYVNYFAVREDDLRFPLFRGGLSVPVTRAAFLGGDAVTVLPYDPFEDAVLVVRQFRFGPYARGDHQPWCLEPIAGRIDPGETPEETARREAVEEAGLTLTQMYPVARYYPSPSAYTEFIYSFVAPADLTRIDGRVSGAAEEAEDIQSRVVPVERLPGMIASGEIDTGPLVMSVFWLLANRDRLRH